MDMYQLVPTSCYDDDDDGGNSEFWSPGTPDTDEDVRGSHADAAGDNGSGEMGWYNVVDHHEDGCPASVLPVHRLLSLAAGHLRFFDDDDSSVENETFFGRTLDTISEEDEDDVMERAAATDADVEMKQQSSTSEEHRLAK